MASEVRQHVPPPEGVETPDRTQKRTVARHRDGEVEPRVEARAGARERNDEAASDAWPEIGSHFREAEISDDWTDDTTRGPEGEPERRAARPSVRPSAFGAPRPSPKTAGAHASSGRPSTVPPRPPAELSARTETRMVAGSARSEMRPAPLSSRPDFRAGTSAGARQTAIPDARSGPRAATRADTAPTTTSAPPARRGLATDIEQLLPLSQGVRSLPQPPRLPAFEGAAPSAPPARRLPVASLSVFAVVVASSTASLLHYRNVPAVLRRTEDTRIEAPRLEATQRVAATPSGGPSFRSRAEAGASTALEQRGEDEPDRDAVARIERTFWGKPARIREALLEEGRSALSAADDRLAETLFARAAELGGDRSDAATGLAQVRLAQGDLEGAEGWLMVAIRAHPRNSAYRALYADVLERWGRHHEARIERALARSLAHFSGETRAR